MSFKTLLAAFFAGMLMLMALACEQEGPAERAGEQVDETVEQAGEGMGEAGERVQE